MRHMSYHELNQLSILQSQTRLTGSALYAMYDSAALAKADAQVAFFASPTDPDCTSLPTHNFGGRNV